MSASGVLDVLARVAVELAPEATDAEHLAQWAAEVAPYDSIDQAVPEAHRCDPADCSLVICPATVPAGEVTA